MSFTAVVFLQWARWSSDSRHARQAEYLRSRLQKLQPIRAKAIQLGFRAGEASAKSRSRELVLRVFLAWRDGSCRGQSGCREIGRGGVDGPNSIDHGRSYSKAQLGQCLAVWQAHLVARRWRASWEQLFARERRSAQRIILCMVGSQSTMLAHASLLHWRAFSANEKNRTAWASDQVSGMSFEMDRLKSHQRERTQGMAHRQCRKAEFAWVRLLLLQWHWLARDAVQRRVAELALASERDQRLQAHRLVSNVSVAVESRRITCLKAAGRLWERERCSAGKICFVAWMLWLFLGRPLQQQRTEHEQARELIESSNSWLLRLQEERGELQEQLSGALEQVRQLQEAWQAEVSVSESLAVELGQLRDAHSKRRVFLSTLQAAESAAAAAQMVNSPISLRVDSPIMEQDEEEQSEEEDAYPHEDDVAHLQPTPPGSDIAEETPASPRMSLPPSPVHPSARDSVSGVAAVLAKLGVDRVESGLLLATPGSSRAGSESRRSPYPWGLSPVRPLPSLESFR